MIHLALVDDHQITRKGIKTIIEMNPDIKVTLEASNGKELLDKLSPARVPDIVIMDINMPLMNGFETMKVLASRYPALKVIIFSLIMEEDTIINMISSGASAYITKNADPSRLADAVITVQTKGYYLCDQVKKEYFRNYAKQKPKPGFTGKLYLSPKELQLIRLASTNLSYKEIANQMGLQPKTISNYRDRLFQKLDIKNRAALVIYGFKNGIINIFPE